MQINIEEKNAAYYSICIEKMLVGEEGLWLV